jgi:hypothetical protein
LSSRILKFLSTKFQCPALCWNFELELLNLNSQGDFVGCKSRILFENTLLTVLSLSCCVLLYLCAKRTNKIKFKKLIFQCSAYRIPLEKLQKSLPNKKRGKINFWAPECLPVNSYLLCDFCISASFNLKLNILWLSYQFFLSY